MTEIVITITQFFWRICYLTPAVMLIVLKRKKKASVRTFFKGMALSFLLNILAFAGLYFTNEDTLTLLVYPAAMVIGFVLFYCAYHEDDTPDIARSRALGAAQFVLLFWAFFSIYGLQLLYSDRKYVPITDADLIKNSIFFLILALIKIAIVLLCIFGTYKAYSSQKYSGRKKVLLSSLFATLICFGVLACAYIFNGIMYLIS